MKLFSAKHALTAGIEEVEGKMSEIGELFTVTATNGCADVCGFSYCLDKGQYHVTREEAIKAANKMRDKKIENLQRQIKKLSALKFS